MLISWSAGLDSTYLLLCVLFPHNNEPTKSIRTISINSPQVLQYKKEKEQRKIIKRILKKSYGKTFDSQEVNISETKPGMICNQLEGLSQPTLWVSLSTLYLDTNEDLYMGYVRGDDFWHFKKHVVKAFKSQQKLLGKKGKLLFPLEWKTKAKMISHLKKNFKDIYDNVTYCEENKEKPCGVCVCCKRHLLAEYESKKFKIKE